MIWTLKHASLRILKQSGVSRWVAQTAWRRSRLLILCYHGISLTDEHLWAPGLYMSAERFERRLALIRQNDCRVLPLGEAIDRLYCEDLPDRAVVLTFDDGYFDFIARAWPLLQAYGYPATVYLTTGRVEHNLPNVNLFMSYVLWKARTRVLNGTGIVGLDGEYTLSTSEHRTFVIERITDAMQASRSPELDRDAVARQLTERLGLDYTALLQSRVLTLMRPDEVARVSRDGVDVELHTHLHRSPDDADEFVRDVLVNRDRIETMTGVRPVHLCYPSGNYRPAYLPALRRHGIASATTCDPGIAGRRSDPLLLPRFVDTDATDVMFEGWLTGMAPCLPRRTRRGGSVPRLELEPRLSRQLASSEK
jgi:peptidoglycan/xylan/chitin deacetylase (PgdA/CDA1 family)